MVKFVMTSVMKYVIPSSARLLACTTMLVLAQACMTRPTPTKYYDFGPMTKTVASLNNNNAPGCRLPPIVLDSITAPHGLSSNLMLYRLLYANDQQTHNYANHRWNMTPAQLVTQRIKMRLAQNGFKLFDSGVIDKLNVLQLRLELEDFNHYFTDATHSYAQIQLRVSIIRDRRLLDQTMLQQQVNAGTADAPGGAHAMRLAADELILHLSHWLCEQQAQL